MTTRELTTKLNDEYGITKPWPDTYEVDHDTYANVCQDVFTWVRRMQAPGVAIGVHDGIMFKNVELLLKTASVPITANPIGEIMIYRLEQSSGLWRIDVTASATGAGHRR